MRQGRTLVERIMREDMAVERELLSSLDPAQQKRLETLLRGLNRVLEDAPA